MPPLVKHRVLVSGFGPFGRFEVNPSWLAAEQLNGRVIFTNSPRPETIQITSIQVPTVYTSVLEIVPGLHASPPTLPDEFKDRESAEDYTLIVHIGVGYSGPLRFETVAHKTGYDRPDHRGEFADILDTAADPPVRGFADGKYEALPEELHTNIDAAAIVEKLEKQGVQIRTSADAGHFLCDFIYYCSLAGAALGGKGTPVAFIHCPPISEPLTTDEVVNGIQDIIVEICSTLS